jgi:hypothetical protein
MDVTASLNEPRFRGRLNWSRTVKEGWRVNDMTVEISNLTPNTFDIARGHARALAIDLYQDGCQEADRRNEIERLGDAA